MSTQLGDRIIGELLALVAHDLRNPLSALHSNLDFVRSLENSGDPAFDEALEDGLVSCEGLNHIIDNLDLLGRALRQQIDGTRERVDIAALVRDVVTRSERMAESHGVRLELEDGPFRGEVELRRELTGRAVANLVRNSVQHAGAARRVNVIVRREDADAVIVVRDRGTRFDGAFIEDPFSADGQLAAKAAQHGRYSRGLGLFCARIAAEADGWTVGVESTSEENILSMRRPVVGASGE